MHEANHTHTHTQVHAYTRTKHIFKKKTNKSPILIIEQDTICDMSFNELYQSDLLQYATWMMLITAETSPGES